VWAKDYADELVGLFRHTLDTGDSYVSEERAEFRLDRGVTEYSEWRIDRIALPDGRYGVACYFRDISAQVQVRMDIADSEAKFRQLAESLGEANRLKDEFLATLSHELRTPLNAILGWSHMLRSGALPANTQKRALEALDRNAKAQMQLVQDLLDVSRIISGKFTIKSDPVDMATVIAGAIDAIRPSASAKLVRLNVVLDPESPIVVTGDADRLQQVAWNLLSNAVKFTPGGGRVDVEVRRCDAHAELIVKDSGQGIDPAFLPHVFERFRQADSSPARTHGGLGLGLAIVRHLTEAHGGTVSAESAGKDQGAIFVVRLPVRPAQRFPLAAAGIDGSARGPSKGKHPKKASPRKMAAAHRTRTRSRRR
jgi:signal transduction histidine kinase